MSNITYKYIVISLDKLAGASFPQLSYDVNVNHPVRHVKMRLCYNINADEDTSFIFRDFSMFQSQTPTINTGAFVPNGSAFIYNQDLSSCQYDISFNSPQCIQGTYTIQYGTYDDSATVELDGYLLLQLAFHENY